LSKTFVEYAAPDALVRNRYFFRVERTVGIEGAVCVEAPTRRYVALQILEIALHQNYSRYRSREFERRWQARLKASPRATSDLQVVVTHRFPAPNRYGWELRPPTGLYVEESRVQFASWEEASQAGKLALKQLSTER
jgi:hypothetical protein